MDNESGDYHNIRLCDPVEIPRSMCRGFVSAIDRRHFDIIDFTVDWVSLEGYGMIPAMQHKCWQHTNITGRHHAIWQLKYP